jgi:CHAD domain-containing protein
VLLGFLDEMENSVAGTVADVDTEFLHDFRVAVRRSRSAVKLLGDALPPRLVTWAAPQLKWLGDLTTPVRDLDVHLLGLPDAAARLHGGRPEDLQPLAAYLQQVRAGERRTLVRGLRSVRFTRFRARWRTELEALAGATPPEGSGPPAGAPESAADNAAGEPTAAAFGAQRLTRAHRRVLRPGSRIVPASPPEALHDLRKRGKELRYLLEIFSGLLRPEARPLVKELKGLQDVLGTFQDSEVQRAAVVGMAESMLAAGVAPAATLLAMGEIAARLHDDQVAARREFAARFERFAAASPSGALLR